jgi:hypothetical protein
LKVLHRIILGCLSLGVVIGIVWILQQAGDYYLASTLERPHMSQHRAWKPGGPYGHGLGIIGSTGMIIMFSYSLRKRVRRLRKLGHLRTWLNYHIFLGIVCPIIITFHTTFKFGGLVSISYWSMVAVAISGFIGRYIYVKIPRRVSGKELTLQEFEARDRELKENLKIEYNLSSETMQRIERLSGAEKIQQRGLLGIFTLFALDLVGWYSRWRIIREITETSNIPKSKLKPFKQLLKKRIKAARQIAFWNTAHTLFHYWHVIHRPFAYTMILIMIVHVITAILFGYTWIL